MASALPPVKGVAISFETALVAQADTDIFKAGPTLAAGDCKVIKDGTYDDNIDSLPAAVSSCTNVITVALSATEMDADRVTVVLHDAAGDEWQDQVITIFTSAQTLNATDIIADDIKTIVGHADYGNAKLVRSSTPANALVVDAAGLVDANVVKVGPTGAGTAQTAGDVMGTLGVAGAGLTAFPQMPAAFLSEITAQYGVETRIAFIVSNKAGTGGVAGLVFGSPFSGVCYLVTLTGATLITNVAAHPAGQGFYIVTLSAAQMQFKHAFLIINESTGALGRPVYFSLTTYGSAAAAITSETTLLAAIADVPTLAEMEARTLAAADYTVVSDLPAAAPSVADIKTALEANGSKLDQLWEMTEDDGGVRRLTANALKEASIGGGDAPTVTQIRQEMDANSTKLADILTDTGTTLPGLLAGIGAGSGTGTYSDIVTDGVNPVDGVRVVLYTDSALTHAAYQVYTDALGTFTMHPDPGTYYRQVELAGYTGTQGVQVVVA